MSNSNLQKWPGFIVWPAVFAFSIALWVLIGMAAQELLTGI